MFKRLTEPEVRETLSRMLVLIDSREKVNDHIVKYFDKNNVNHETRKLDVGDYSVQLEGLTAERDIAIERKASLNELCGNFTTERVRFEDEFIRARAFGTKVFLVVEDATWDDIYVHNYSSKLNEKALIASLLAWQTRYNVTIIFCKKQNAPKTIYGILWYAAREKLMGG